MGTNNFLNFVFITVGSAFYWILRSRLALGVQPLLSFCGVLTILLSGYLFWDLRHYLARRVREITKEDN